ncbi:MAG: hypothetical protein RBR02_08900 [Desulfuromonadaceae bacterium]|nr:hypothetical protein [Desulfuromonadaceae bacterium]
MRHRMRIILSIVQILALVGLGSGVRPVAAFQPLQVDDVRSKDPALPEELGFADTLFAQQDFYRAVTEYKRFVYQYPKHPEVGRARLNMARATIAAQRWEDARVMLGELLEKDVAKHITAQTHVLVAEIPYQQGKFDASFCYLEQVAGLELAPAFTQRVRELQLWSLLEGERLQEAQTFLRAHEVELRPNLEDILTLEELPHKSPRLAGTLSALLPGAGQLYNGRYREAGMAFALNAAFIAGGIQAINTGNTVLGGILLFFEAGWYGGNIYNAVNTAHKSNRRAYRSALEPLRNKYQFSLLSAERGPMLQLRTRF